MDATTALNVSSGFAGGMYLGSVCGAITGGIMAIGLKHNPADRQSQIDAFNRDEYAEPGKSVRAFADRFKAVHRSINCPDLLGVDLSTPGGLRVAKEKKLFAVCPGIVRDAAAIVSELLDAGRD